MRIMSGIEWDKNRSPLLDRPGRVGSALLAAAPCCLLFRTYYAAGIAYFNMYTDNSGHDEFEKTKK